MGRNPVSCEQETLARGREALPVAVHTVIVVRTVLASLARFDQSLKEESSVPGRGNPDRIRVESFGKKIVGRFVGKNRTRIRTKVAIVQAVGAFPPYQISGMFSRKIT